MMLPARSPTHFPGPRMSHWRISVSPAWLEICDSCSKLLREHRLAVRAASRVILRCCGEQWVVSPLGAQAELLYSALCHDKCPAERAQHQCDRIDYCLSVVFGCRILLGKIQGAPAQIWKKS